MATGKSLVILSAVGVSFAQVQSHNLFADVKDSMVYNGVDNPGPEADACVHNC